MVKRMVTKPGKDLGRMINSRIKTGNLSPIEGTRERDPRAGRHVRPREGRETPVPGGTWDPGKGERPPCREARGTGDPEILLHRLAWPLADRAARNRAKWGPQDFQVLGLAVCEEAGELAQAVLQARFEGGDLNRIRQEAIDLGALCLQVLAILPKSPGIAPGGARRGPPCQPGGWHLCADPARNGQGRLGA